MKSYMERKYYLRGLGIGIAVTAIIMGIATSGKQTMTDEDVIARAKELGMVENTVLSDTPETAAEQDPTDEIEKTAETAAEQNPTDEIEKTAETAAEQNPTDESKKAETAVEQDPTDESKKTETAAEQNPTDESKKAESAAEQNEADEIEKTETAAGQNTATAKKEEDKKADITSAAIKTITINSGDGSYTVAKKLADVGVVISAENFDTYLCQHGYDKKLRTGTFSIPADASDEQIARIVTGVE